MTPVRRAVRWACAVAVLVVAVAAARIGNRYQPPDQWVPDLVVGVSAVALALASWRRSWATSVLALLVAGCWWAGTAWAFALYWHRGAFVALALAAPAVRPRSRLALAVVGVVGAASLAAQAWRYDWVSLTMAGIVVVGAVAEARARRAGRWLVAPGLVATAIGGAAIGDALGVGPVALLLAYDAVLVGVLVTIGVVTRAPGHPMLADLAVDVGPDSVRDVATLLRLVGAEPGLEADLKTAIAAAQRWEAANSGVRTQLDAAVVEVTASRRRLVTAAAEERARLAATVGGPTLGALRDAAERAGHAGVAPVLLRAVASLQTAVAGLRAPGLDGGVAAAVRDLPLIEELAAELDLSDRRCPAVVEDTLFAVAAEGLSNVAKYAGPCRVVLRYLVVADCAELTLTDDGVGGARIGAGSGLVGLADRVEALGGRFAVVSSAGAGTTVTATVPLTGGRSRPADVGERVGEQVGEAVAEGPGR